MTAGYREGVRHPPDLAPALISAPFGNYVRPDGATATLGTFTAAERPGRLWRVLKTVRYYPRLRAWVNKIGLRNPGVAWLERRVADGREDVARCVVSVHGFVPDDWWALLDAIARLRPAAVELNMSCPNVGEIHWPEELFARAVATGVPVIAKIPPVRYDAMVDQALAAGVTTLHCCNTLPVDAGGLSGAPLKPVSLAVISALRDAHGAALSIIGGGGIRTVADVDDYARVGADRIALGSITMNPIVLVSHARLRPLIARAHERFSVSSTPATR